MRRRRSRVRWMLKWAATVACGLTLAAMAACLYWKAIEFRSDRLCFSIGGGEIVFLLTTDEDFVGTPPNGSLKFFVAKSWKAIVGEWSGSYVWPRALGRPGLYVLNVPLWIPLVVFGGLTGWLWWRDRRGFGPGRCLKCGYDLTGNVSERCPECGETLAVGDATGAGG